MNFKADLLCSICELVFSEPVSLPCGCTVCANHTRHVASVTCAVCEHEFEVPTHGFQTNKCAKNILEKNGHLSDDEKALKLNIQGVIQRLETLVSSFKQSEADFELLCNDHFNELRRHVDIQREELKQKIDEIALNMIDQLKQHEIVYRQKLCDDFAKIAQIDSRALNVQLEEEFRKQSIALDRINAFKHEQEQTLDALNTIVSDFSCTKNKVISTQFKASEDFRRLGYENK